MGFKLYSPDSLIWLDWLESEHANVAAALAAGLTASAVSSRWRRQYWHGTGNIAAISAKAEHGVSVS
ncbi:MAG: hypothetical protein U0528_00660 [Anaerolineae bacterium]